MQSSYFHTTSKLSEALFLICKSPPPHTHTLSSINWSVQDDMYYHPQGQPENQHKDAFIKSVITTWKQPQSQSFECREKRQHICVWSGISRLAVLCLKRNIQVMSCCFCRMTQIRSFVLDAQSLNHAFISTRLAELFILGTVAEINWPPAALNLALACDPICCNLMSSYNVFFWLWKSLV